MLVVLTQSANASRFDIQEAYNDCLDIPEYALGGSMAGDCMIDRSAELDLEIETLLARAAKKYCQASDREAIAASQSAWLDYREGYCTLIENSPGNTGAWINGGACRLDITQKRLESLHFLTDHAYSWCGSMQLLGSLNHFGDPVGLSRHDDEAGIAWSVREDADGRFLDISSNQTAVKTSIDITPCNYCSSGTDCNDGVFSFSHEDEDGNLSHGIAHLCTVEPGGPRLHMVELTPSGAPLRTTIDATRHIAWMIDDGRLRIAIDGNDNVLYWPEAKPGR